MATLYREIARQTCRQIRSRAQLTRGLHASRQNAAAQNFTMPAMSPTMTEGNIAKWAVKEGDSFSSGDVLLEIETDKAQMEVEAQDDGVLFKIMEQEGAKGVKVGSRIAVIAEQSDDLKSLEIPDGPEAASTSKSVPEKSDAEEAPKETKKSDSQPAETKSTSQKEQLQTDTDVQKMPKQKYPLYPSVIQLLHVNGIDLKEADKIKATGPQGRLLKGDVLAHLGKIQKTYAAELSTRLAKLGHLDLSNIKLAEPKQIAKIESKLEALEVPDEVNLAVSVSFAELRKIQKKCHDALGVDVALSTFIERAVALANEGLPRAKRPLTADELYDELLGTDRAHISASDAFYVPELSSYPSPSSSRAFARPTVPEDIYDTLLGPSSPRRNIPISRPAARAIVPATNVFTLTVPKAEEKRGKVFLERVKTVLQVEPGSLIL